ncbi:MAG TPA: dUTP diphosphatase [Candidatus Kapabacteria bacterium]|nr:dUTP diphosphatase [Candidatus Kapabacteria bacterium]
MKVKIVRIDPNLDLPLPSYATIGSAGMDICASNREPIIIVPRETLLVPTGLSIELSPGYECQVRSRSGLAAKYGIFCLNAPGTIDSDYRGEIKIILSNFGNEHYTINYGDRIAQLVIAKYERVEWELSESLSNSERGSGGFGSTGK